MKEMQNVGKKKNVFLERLSHEIRIPMNSIIGLTYLSKENIDNTKQVLENLDKIEKSAQFLRSFMDDLLNLSRLESGRVSCDKEEICFTRFLEELAGQIRSRAEQKQIQFFMETRGDLEQNYYFDGGKLKEALRNILQNAVKFTLAGGRVDFIAELVKDGEESGTFRFEVRDTGVGMEPEFLEKVFEPFEQEGEAGATLYGGCGLGLPISKSIINFMNGKIDAYSKKGQGTTVVVVVELDKAGAAGQVRQSSEKNEFDFAGKRALLVEDNDINVELMKKILIHKNFKVDVASNGREGVDQFLNRIPGYYDVILMDIRMPVMDGLTAAKMIRESSRPDSKTVPIIALTANVFEEDVEKSHEAGMNAHLSKPVDIRQMYGLLQNQIFG